MLERAPLDLDTLPEDREKLTVKAESLRLEAEAMIRRRLVAIEEFVRQEGIDSGVWRGSLMIWVITDKQHPNLNDAISWNNSIHIRTDLPISLVPGEPFCDSGGSSREARDCHLKPIRISLSL